MNQTIMVVDDDPISRRILRKILESDGYRVIAEARDGIEAVEKYRQFRPSITIMDNMMPEKSGIEASRDIVALNQDAKLIMCSSLCRDSFENSARLAGVSELIPKPFTVQQVLDVVGRFMLNV
jgi:two-component system chemotaxis response regulator CheY